MDDRERRIRTAERTAVYRRNYRRARDRALARLGKKYPKEYLKLLEEERERDAKKGTHWYSLAGRPGPVRSRGARAVKSSRPHRNRRKSK